MARRTSPKPQAQPNQPQRNQPDPNIAPGKAIEFAIQSMLRAGYSRPEFLVAQSHLRDRYSESYGLPTMGIDAKGRIVMNPVFVLNLGSEECAGVLAHEIMHHALDHWTRKGGRDHSLWNVAGDCIINDSLRSDGWKLPEGCLYTPPEYQGEKTTEALYDWLKENPDKNPQQGQGQDGDGEPDVGQGCGPVAPRDLPGGDQNDDGSTRDGSTISGRDLAGQMDAIGRQAGRGTSAVVNALKPVPSRMPWRSILERGASVAVNTPRRDYTSYSRRSRRSPIVGPQFPGWRGTEATLAIAIDVSGSMAREWLAKVLGRIDALARERPNIKVFLVTHTDSVPFSGWITPTQRATLAQAVSFSGGTDPGPAYETIAKAGGSRGFDCLVHFTDTEFGASWPKVPARRLVVGKFGSGSGTPAPAGAEVIPCDMES